MYSYGSTMALPCRGCGKGFQETDKVVSFEKRRFHQRCYVCTGCKKAFEETNTRLPGAVREMPYCNDCYADAALVRCDTCQEPIRGAFLNVQGYPGKKFHKECFRCTKCGTPLEDAFRKRKDGPQCVKCPSPAEIAARLKAKAEEEELAYQEEQKASTATSSVSAIPDSGSVAATADDSATITGPKFCSSCGTKRASLTAKFCGQCGGKY